MAALKVPVLLALFCVLSQWTNCQEQDGWSFHSKMTIDSVDMVAFRCPQSIYWRLQPGFKTIAFVEGFAGMREFYSNCIGNTSCKVKRAFVSHLLNQTESLYPRETIGLEFFNNKLLMCRPGEYFHGINSSDRTPLTISNHDWHGYIYTTGTQSMELTPNITISNPKTMDIQIRPYYLYDATDPYLYDRMTMHIEGPGIGCVVLDHSEPRKWITTNMKTIRIFFSSCSRSGRFGIGYLYHRASGFYVPNRLVVVDGGTPLTGQHTCSQRHNRCPQPSPTPTPTSTSFPQHSTPAPDKDVTAQSTILHAADSTVSSSGSSASSSSSGSSVSSKEKADVPTVSMRTFFPVTNGFPDVTGQSVSSVTNASPDVTSQAFLPSVNTSGTGPQRADQSGVGVVVGGSIAGGILLAVLVILILVFFLRKRKCLPSRKQPDLPQRVESVAPTAPGMEILVRESHQSSRVNPGNMYAVVNRDRRRPPPRPLRPVRDDSLTIVENDLYSSSDRVPGHRGLTPSASVFIVENDGYDSVQWGGRP